MNHETAVKTQAAERYFLGELTTTERNSFEEHYFECAACADLVRETFVFGDTTAALLREQPRIDERRGEAGVAAPRARFWQLFPSVPVLAAACMMLAVFNVAQLRETQNLTRQLEAVSAPQSVATITLMRTRGTGGQPAVVPAAGSQFFELLIDIPPGGEARSYLLSISRSDGTAVSEDKIAAPSDGGPLRILLRTSRFPAGAYVLQLRGEGRPDGESFPFTVGQ